MALQFDEILDFKVELRRNLLSRCFTEKTLTFPRYSTILKYNLWLIGFGFKKKKIFLWGYLYYESIPFNKKLPRNHRNI
jgi:hypothetical protein